MRVVITGHGDKRTLRFAKRLSQLLKGHEVAFGDELAKILAPRSPAFKKPDVIIAIGGDGTIMRAIQTARGAPILGIHIGGRGFLAQVEPAEMKKAVGKLLSGKLKVTEAMMLKSIVKGRRLPDALNEVSAISATPGKTVSLKMSIEGEEIGELAGDGLIAATPTGSTAYSLAAGGPVVAPEIEAIILTPICPSGKSLPPMVIPPGKEVWIEPTRDGRDAAVLVDGKASCKLKRGERIVIAKSERKARFYAWRDFYSSLKKKLL